MGKAFVLLDGPGGVEMGCKGPDDGCFLCSRACLREPHASHLVQQVLPEATCRIDDSFMSLALQKLLVWSQGGSRALVYSRLRGLARFNSKLRLQHHGWSLERSRCKFSSGKATRNTTPASRKKQVNKAALPESTANTAGKENDRSKLKKGEESGGRGPENGESRSRGSHIPVDPTIAFENLPEAALERLRYLEGQYSLSSKRTGKTYLIANAALTASQTKELEKHLDIGQDPGAPQISMEVVGGANTLLEDQYFCCRDR